MLLVPKDQNPEVKNGSSSFPDRKISSKPSVASSRCSDSPVGEKSLFHSAGFECNRRLITSISEAANLFLTCLCGCLDHRQRWSCQNRSHICATECFRPSQ